MATSLGSLTDAAIRSWVAKGKGSAIHDGSGLYLRRRSNGAFWALRQVNVATQRRTWAALFPNLPYPQASLAAARKAAAAAKLVEHAQQQDIASLRKTRRAEARERHAAMAKRITVRTLFTQWRSIELTPRLRADGSRVGRKDGGQSTFEFFTRYVFPAIGDTTAADVRTRDLMNIFDTCKAAGKRRTANVLYADLKQMFRFAVTREIVTRNPLDAVRKTEIGGKDVERNRVLSDEEIRELIRKLPLAGMEPQSRAAILLMLATACRISEIMNAEWTHIDLNAQTLYLPDTKNQRDHTIHLSAFAVRQLEVIRGYSLKNHGPGANSNAPRWVFPNSTKTGPVCVKSLGKQISDRQRSPESRFSNRTQKCDALALSGGRWTAHDLRRTAATIMARLDVSTDVIDECLNHKLQSRVARVYIQDRRLKAQQAAFEALGAHLTALQEDSGDRP